MLPRFPKSEKDFSSTKAEAKLKCVQYGKFWCDHLSENNLLSRILDQIAKGSRKSFVRNVVKWKLS